MGSSLRKKRKAKAAGTTVKVGRVKKTTQKVSVKPVLLPGAKAETKWDQHTTHQSNYDHVGIVSDPNKFGKTGRNSQKLVELGDGVDSAAVAKAKRLADTSVAAQATVGGDEVRGMMGQVRSTGLAPPKRLTTKQRRIVGALVVRTRRTRTGQLLGKGTRGWKSDATPSRRGERLRRGDGGALSRAISINHDDNDHLSYEGVR